MNRKKIAMLTVGSVAVGAVIALGATGIALAATGGLHGPDRGGVHAEDRMPGGMPGMERGGPGRGDNDGRSRVARLGGMRGALPLHSETVVKQQDGTILTIVGVSGTVTAVSATSITIAAEDGFSATYAVGADTQIGKDRQQASIVDVVVGDEAMAMATEVGGSLTADRILVGDLTNHPGKHDGLMGGGMDSDQDDTSPGNDAPSSASPSA